MNKSDDSTGRQNHSNHTTIAELTGMSSVTAAPVFTGKNWFINRLTPTVVLTKLKAMAAMFNWRPSLRHHLSDTHPVGTPFEFRATIEFVNWDSKCGVHVVFSAGKMRVHSGPAKKADLTVRFKGYQQMRQFFSGADTFHMLLDNTTGTASK